MSGPPASLATRHTLILAPQAALMCAAVAVGLIMTLALAIARVVSAISFVEPLQGMTRGVEYEMLYSIWKYIHGLPLYQDQHAIPFTASFYNWLIYAFYGEVARAILALFQLSDAWIPTIGRITSLTGTSIGAFLACRTLVRSAPLDSPLLRHLGIGFGLFLFFGPLVGFWAMAVGPDMWPLAALAGITHLYVFHDRKRPLLCIFAACTAGYLCWAFKQNFVFIPAIVGLYLLIRRRWLHLISMAGTFVATTGATLLVGGERYVRSLAVSDTHLTWSVDILVGNIVNVTAKLLPLIGLWFAVGALLVRHEPTWRPLKGILSSRPGLLLPYLGLAVTAVEALFTGGFFGASENHFLAFSYFLGVSGYLTFTTTLQAASSPPKHSPKLVPLAIGAGWVGNALAVAAVFLGLQGIVSVRKYHDSLTSYVRCVGEVRQPVFSANPYLALPWMIAGNPPFVVYYNYPTDRAAGIKMEHGGIGGLIAKGYFGTIILYGGMTTYDGVPLTQYRSRPNLPCSEISVFDRIDENPSSSDPLTGSVGRAKP